MGSDKADTVLSVGYFSNEVCSVWPEFRLSIPADLFQLFDSVLPDLVARQGVLLFGKADFELPSLGRFRLRSGSERKAGR